VAESLWRAAGSSCSSVWGEFQDSVDRKVRTKGWDATATGAQSPSIEVPELV